MTVEKSEVFVKKPSLADPHGSYYWCPTRHPHGLSRAIHARHPRGLLRDRHARKKGLVMRGKTRSEDWGLYKNGKFEEILHRHV
jgi:hypothetical protein